MNAAQKHAASSLAKLREELATHQKTIANAEAAIVSISAQITALEPIANPPAPVETTEEKPA
jgi:hypothetical protein